jgi:hypothetical protein
MREPDLVPSAIFAPGHCMVCGGNYGPMIDTRVDIPGDGRMYICTHVCLPMIIRRVHEQIPELIAGIIGPVDVSRRCVATKVDGTACTARALPNRRYCVAHSKLETKEEDDGRLVGADLR